jgi:ATPase subunit of ABC transporter with duplicated ATPase domains
MLVVRGLGVSFGDRDLLYRVSFEIRKGERVALLGDNGCGKSTLLRVLSGETAPTQVEVLRYEEVRRVVHVAQVPDAPLDALSSGQRARRRIADALEQRPDLLLLDEPENHLDGDGLAWLEAALKAFAGALLFAAHDRAFVDIVAQRVLLIQHGGVRSFDGGYTAMRRRLDEETAARLHRHEDWRRERERLRGSASRQREWAERAHRAAGERNPVAKRRAAQLMHKALASESRLRRLDADRVEKPWQEPPLSFAFLLPRNLPPVLVRAQDLAFKYQGEKHTALRPLSFDVRRGERLALVGANGSGKTTLLRLLAERGGEGIAPLGDVLGSLEVHPALRVFILRQEATLPEGRTPLSAMLRAGAPDTSLARTLLGHFHLQGDAALRPISELSPGEAVRLMFCLCLVRGADMLLLDEPTNHLDLIGREALESALASYPGTVVFASHDRRFVSAVATRRLDLRGQVIAPGDPIDSRDLLQMRLAELTGRLGRTRGTQREALGREIDAVVAKLRRLADRRDDGDPLQ